MRLMFTWVLGRYVAFTVLYPNLLEAADRVGGQLRGDKECPLSGVTNSGSLEEGAGKRYSECGGTLDCKQSKMGFKQPRMGLKTSSSAAEQKSAAFN